jgi:hypothetical protein
MPMTAIFRYRVYDMSKDEYAVSTRMATLEKIKRIGGEPIRDKYTKIDESLLVDGWTEKNFDPRGNWLRD